jgi:hypothetical protein
MSDTKVKVSMVLPPAGWRRKTWGLTSALFAKSMGGGWSKADEQVRFPSETRLRFWTMFNRVTICLFGGSIEKETAL